MAKTYKYSTLPKKADLDAFNDNKGKTQFKCEKCNKAVNNRHLKNFLENGDLVAKWLCLGCNHAEQTKDNVAYIAAKEEGMRR